MLYGACVDSETTLFYRPFMQRRFTAVIKQTEEWWIGWIEEIPGVNSQGKTREELMENLQSALQEALEFNREDALKAAQTDYEEAAVVL